MQAMSRAQLDKQPHDVAGMFDGVAKRYDTTNSVLSFGQDRRWRKAVTTALDLRPGEVVLDLAAGTGVSTVPLVARGAHAVAVDFSLGMLKVGHQHRPGVSFLAGDATRLPFATASFDAVTMSFGLRNVVDVRAALLELLRVTRPGGRLVIAEFSRPTWAPWRKVYLEYLVRALPQVARLVSSNGPAYKYLAESIRAWPDQEGLAALLHETGWSEVAYRNLNGGIVALHRALRI